jgi:hypothetical protein
MTKKIPNSGFALAVTLALMALAAIVVIAYLSSAQIQRSTASVYANRLRAQIHAESALAAAIQVLRSNTRYGNYITAMPAPSPSPAPLYTELYRPDDSVAPTTVSANNYLQLSNAGGEILVSLGVATAAGSPPQVDPRPTPQTIPTPLPANSPFGLSTPAPALTVANSYDFNQIVRVAGTDGRLVEPSPPGAGTPRAAFGQWVRVRNSNTDLIGRYAFFIEDESMKVNVNATGNAYGSPNLRIDDLAALPNPTPSSQIQEIDPTAILPTNANRSTASSALVGLGSPGARLPTKGTTALLNVWDANTPDLYAHLLTVLSKDDNTTAKGWQRLNLNKIVSDAETAGTPQAKANAANTIANWIRDAWTGPTAIAGLQDYQLYGDDWSRKQLAANIVDYIDTDFEPTDVGDIAPAGFPNAVPVIGIEKTPYLAGVHVVYQASGSTYPGAGIGSFTATLKMKIHFHFLNLHETVLDLADALGNRPQSRIEVKGIPIVQKNGGTVYNGSTATWTIKLSDLKPVSGGSGTGTTVAAGVDVAISGTSTTGAKTFETDWLDTQTVSFTVAARDNKPTLSATSISVKLIGNKTGTDYRVDDTSIVTSGVTTQDCNGTNCAGASGDFLKDATSATFQIASMNYAAGYQGAIVAGATPGDPRYRGRLVSDRWNNNASRTDASLANNRLDSLVDKADLNPRAYGFDWFDNAGNRPLAFTRNGAMVNIGELGHVPTCEYPWRTIYLQYPERPSNTTASGPATDVPLRRSNNVDHVLVDLFQTSSSSSRTGAININGQQRYGTQQHALGPLLLGVRVGSAGGAVSSGTNPGLTQTVVDRLCATTGSASHSPIFDRRIATGSPADNTPLRPFFQPGELASVMSRLVNTSPGASATTGSPARSTVNYSALRTTTTSATEAPVNTNIQRDMQVEQEFREISNSITTRGNVFRVLYVGQAIKDVNKNGNVDLPEDVKAEFLGEAYLERQPIFAPAGTNPDAIKTSDSTYKVLSNRVISE